MTKTKPTVTIDGKTYDLNNLSNATKAQIGNVQAVNRRIAQLQQDLRHVG